ncbi:hypothetical protein [Variovorax sp. V15]|uniref:hypothetical protein n=1 Tax=Variovorax sp. V15 TaxID=3065952 RepID=UPI0034E8AB8A
MDTFGAIEFAVSLIGFGVTIWQLVKTKSAANSAREAADNAVQAIRTLQTATTLQDMAGRTRNLLELLRAKKLSGAAAAAFELRDAVSRLPDPTQLPGAAQAIAWTDVSLEVDALHERLESMSAVNRWAAEEREALILRTARLHTKLAAGSVQVAAAKEN